MLAAIAFRATIVSAAILLSTAILQTASVEGASDHLGDSLAANCPSILVVGCFLHTSLQNVATSCKSSVIGVDCHADESLPCAQVPQHLLASAQVVLYFGGMDCTGDTEADSSGRVNSIMALASRMTDSQLLIFASSTAVTEGLQHVANEDEEAKMHPRVLSLLLQERRLMELSNSSANAPQTIILRLGVLFHSQMIADALSEGSKLKEIIDASHVPSCCCFAMDFIRGLQREGFIRVSAPHSLHPVLHLADLERLLLAIMNAPHRARRFDVFDVASFHSTASRFANELSYLTALPSFETPDVQSAVSSFSVNCSRFETAFSFKFLETIESSARSLLDPPLIPVPPPIREEIQTALIAHFTDQDVPFSGSFIQHHAAMFDSAVVVDRTTSTLFKEVFDAAAPSSWKLLKPAKPPLLVLDVLTPLLQTTSKTSTWVINLKGSKFFVHADIRAFIRSTPRDVLHFPLVQFSETSKASNLSRSCSAPLCHRTLAFLGSATTFIPLTRSTLLANLSAAAAVSSSEGFIADMQSPQSASGGQLHDILDFSSLRFDSDILKQAQAALLQVYGRILNMSHDAT